MIKIKKTNKLSNFISKNVRLSACFSFAVTILIGILLAYYFLPILLNYGPRHN